ncbi:MAG: peptide-N-glycosidase F-related protein [Polyangiaceae bacterium]
MVDVSPMLVHLASGGTRAFRWSFAPEWNKQPTATRLSLRLSKHNKPVRPTSATLLWTGGDFGSGYDVLHPPVEVPIPATAKKVELWAIITGHGAGTGQCAEFCNHVHELTVNGTTFTKDHPEASTDDGCLPEIANGMTPNQGGTWWFGRGGWCPGQQVEPWVVDVTAEVVPGETATLGYAAKLGTVSPPDGAGNIDMVSYLVVHE